MAEIDNKKPEAPNPKSQQDDSVAHALTVFAQSLAYSAIEAPSRGAAQIVDHTFGTKLENVVQSKLNNAGIHKPEEAQFGTHAWAAEQFGSAIGMTAPMWLSRKLIFGKAEQSLVATAAADEGFTTSLKHASIADKALRQASLSAKAGIIYGAVFTPTEDKNSSGNIVVDRFKQGFNSGITFGAMGYSSSMTGGLLNRTAKSLEPTALPSIFKSPLQTALHGSLIHGAISGVPGGIIQAQLGAMENGRPLPTLQDIKENVIGMTMVGGAMGSAGLFNEAPPKVPPKINLELTREIKPHLGDNLVARRKDAGVDVVHQFEYPTQHSNSVRHSLKSAEIASPENFESSNPFDIKFDRIEKAWQPETVNKYMTVETRSVDAIPENRSSLIATANWDEFSQWGVERKDVPVNVYRFPGLQTEIVVPTEYAQLLDQVREHRLKTVDAASGAALAIENPIAAREKRVLPEEIAQMLKQMPHPDIVESVQLLDYADPWDLHASHVQKLEAEKKGLSPNSDQDFVALADATTYTNALGFLRFFESSTNKESELYLTTAHEWAHLAEKDVAFKAFAEAASVERDGFYSRKYALKNNHENWAVHMGERFLNPNGAAFAELPEKAPARTLIMAKALRNMLEAHKDNPSLKHQELLARTAAAEDLAGNKLRENILKDIEHDDQNALDQKLGFLVTAAASAQSPEILARVLLPINRELTPVLETKGIEDPVANEVLARLQTSQLAQNYSAEKMPGFIEKWKAMGDFGPMTDLFKALPEEGQQNLMADLSKDQSGYSRVLLEYMLERTEGAPHQLIHDSFRVAQVNAENHALELLRLNQPLSERYLDWLQNSTNPDARRAASGYRKRQ